MTTVMENRVRNTFTLEKEVDMELKHLIKPRERSEYINKLLKEDLKKKAVEVLNAKIDKLKRIKPVESPIEVLRKFRTDARFNRLINNTNE